MENQLKIENRQVKTMFGVVFLLILGHFLRVVLNVSELAHEIHKYNEENAIEEDSEKKLNENCAEKVPFWELVIISWILKANSDSIFTLGVHLCLTYYDDNFGIWKSSDLCGIQQYVPKLIYQEIYQMQMNANKGHSQLVAIP